MANKLNEKTLSVPEKHQKKIALKTLKMSDPMAKVMGGMTKDEAKKFLKSIGYNDKQIKKLEESKLDESDLRQLIRAMVEQEMDKIDVGDEEDKFDVDEKCDKRNEEEELEEVSTTGDVAGYQTPYAFAGKHKEKQKQNAEQLGYKLVGEPEDRDWKDLEDARKEPLVWRKKFAEMKKRSGLSENKWENKIIEKLKTVDNPNLKSFYEGLINEGRRGAYQNYRDNSDMTTRQKIGESLRSVRNQLTEIEKTIDLNLRLKQETGINSQQYWKRTHRALNRINERMTRIINKIRRF